MQKCLLGKVSSAAFVQPLQRVPFAFTCTDFVGKKSELQIIVSVQETKTLHLDVDNGKNSFIRC